MKGYLTNWFLTKWCCIFKTSLQCKDWIQGILKGEVSLYHWPPVWLVWNQLYDNWNFLLLFAKEVNGAVILPPLVFPAESNALFPVWHHLRVQVWDEVRGPVPHRQRTEVWDPVRGPVPDSLRHPVQVSTFERCCQRFLVKLQLQWADSYNCCTCFVHLWQNINKIGSICEVCHKVTRAST